MHLGIEIASSRDRGSVIWILIAWHYATGRGQQLQTWQGQLSSRGGNHPSLSPFPSVFWGFNGASRSVYLRWASASKFARTNSLIIRSRGSWKSLRWSTMHINWRLRKGCLARSKFLFDIFISYVNVNYATV